MAAVTPIRRSRSVGLVNGPWMSSHHVAGIFLGIPRRDSRGTFVSTDIHGFLNELRVNRNRCGPAGDAVMYRL
jgi:hypothetical protein